MCVHDRESNRDRKNAGEGVCGDERKSNFPKLRGSCRGTLGDRYYCVILHHNPSALPSIEIGWCIADTALTTCGGNTSSHFSVPKCASTSLAFLYLQSQSRVHTENATAVMQAQKRELFTFTSKACLFPPFFCFNCRHQIQVSKNKKRAESHHKRWDPISILD